MTAEVEGAERRILQRIRSPVELLLVAAVTASGALLLVLGSHLTFLFDDWAFLIYRPGWSAGVLLNPHNEHIVLIPVATYKLLLGVFGMDSAFPFRVASTFLFLTSAVLLFAYLCRRVDQWLALAGATLIVFLGGAFEDTLFSFQMGLLGSMASGLGMLLALERGDRTGDRIACLLLAVSFAFSSLGLSFAAGAAVAVGMSGSRWRRSYIVAIPALLFAAWWLGWGQMADSAVSLHNLGEMPLFVVNAMATGLSSLLGLSAPTVETPADIPDRTVAALDWGRPLLVVAGVLGGWRLYRLGRIPRWLWVVAAIGFSFWLLAALNAKPGRSATASRYQYVTAVFILLIAAELLRGVRLHRRGVIAAMVAVSVILISNINLLYDGYGIYRTVSQVERADLGALEIARDEVRPEFLLTAETGDLPFTLTDAGSYLSTADDFGTPAYTPGQIATAPEQARAAADKVLVAALELGLKPVRAPPASSGSPPVLKRPAQALLGESGSCITVQGAGPAPLIQVPDGGVSLRSSGNSEAEVLVRRFAQRSAPVDLGTLSAGATDLLAIPMDRSNVPWKLRLRGSGPVKVCGLGTNPGG